MLRREARIPGKSWPNTHRMLDGSVSLFSYRNSSFIGFPDTASCSACETDIRSSWYTRSSHPNPIPSFLLCPEISLQRSLI